MKFTAQTLGLLAGLQSALVSGKPCGPHRPHWKTLAPIPINPRQEHTTLALNTTHLAILGGIVPTPTPSLYATTPLLQLYNTLTNTWHPTPLPPLPVPLNHPNAAAVAGRIYLLGGLDDEGADGIWRGTGRSWVYDFDSQGWSELPELPGVARGSAAVGVDEATGRVYLAGGMTQLPLVEGAGIQESVDVVSVFDTRAGEWVAEGAVAPLPGRRDHAGVVVVDGVMYVLGGRDQGQLNVRGEVFALDFGRVEEGWVTKEGRMPTARGGVCAGAVGGKVYVFGGEGNPVEGSEGVFDQVEAYDTKTDTWEKLGKMEVPRHGTYAAALGGGVYIPGGGIKLGGAPVDTFNVYYP
ncbi:uncharacterized protein B0H64DRAFT_473845 [Chaetomium fimeti]|uniref:Galactose oxidase n=1 Tax=Chaetomium fimeti TaxID=1854472 RepID=A0AAE0LUA6_9PEZI|nr:hypothetical protein B0H64DRAFT_473845 [Chaetomium fimeti]